MMVIKWSAVDVASHQIAIIIIIMTKITAIVCIIIQRQRLRFDDDDDDVQCLHVSLCQLRLPSC